MKISVIIPVYNEAQYIAACLQSLAQQSLKPLEIIVVDDGSTDDSLLKIQNSGLVILKQAHLGAGAARNLGAKRSRGDILVFVDADMEFDPDFLQNLVSPIINKQTQGTFSTQELVKNWSQPLAQAWSHHFGFHTPNLVDPDRKTSPVFRAILKSEFDRVKGFDLRQGYTDDWSLSRKLGYLASATPAKYHHFNPDTFSEVFSQARWRAKRAYKLGFLGAVYRLIWHSLPFSLINGLSGTIRYQLIIYLPFKIILDLASFLGIIEFYLFKKITK